MKDYHLRITHDYFKIIQDYFKDSASIQLNSNYWAWHYSAQACSFISSMMILTKKNYGSCAWKRVWKWWCQWMNYLPGILNKWPLTTLRVAPLFSLAQHWCVQSHYCRPGFRKHILRHLVPRLRFVISHASYILVQREKIFTLRNNECRL